MIKVKLFALRWFAVLPAIILVAASSGCSHNTTNSNIGAIAGTPPTGLVSVSTEIEQGSVKDDGWTWVWLCDEKGYEENFVNIGVIHADTADPSTYSAAVSFSNQKESFIDNINQTAYAGSPTNPNYFVLSNHFSSDTCLAYMDFYPSQGDTNSTGGTWGLYQGEVMCLRAPNCVAYASLQLGRESSQDATNIFNDTVTLLQNIQIKVN